MRATIFKMRLTLLARSEMMSMLPAGYAARCPCCGMSGRSRGTNAAALPLFKVTICVTIASEVELTLSGRSIDGNCRASVFGMILMTGPAGTAT